MLRLPYNLITLLFPAKCLGCETELSDSDGLFESGTAENLSLGFDFLQAFDHHWCRDCWRELNVGTEKSCIKCGATSKYSNPYEDSCALCHGLDLRFEQAVSIGNYRGMLQELVIQMKNQHLEQMAIQLGNILGYQIVNADFFDDIDLVVPIPTHWWRRARRGFHGAEVLAESVANACQLPVSNHALGVSRSTKKQGTLSNAGRFKNVRNAFTVRHKASVNGRTVLLVDDVMTSGATASEAARILLHEGAAKVYVGVIARGARVS
ncbi:MAG: ComF family protein [Mariniblastus sp.]